MDSLSSRFRLLRTLKQSNAVYDTDYQQLDWPHTAQEFGRFTLMGSGVVLLAVLVLSGVSLALSTAASVIAILYALIVINVLITIGLDVYGTLNTERYINRQIDQGEWADIHTQGLSATEIVHTKYDIVRLRVRRLTIATQVLRAAPYLYAIFLAVLDLILHGNAEAGGNSVAFSVSDLLIALPIVILLVRYEPLWQFNTLAALGLTIAMLVRNPRRATLFGIAAEVAIRLIEAILLLLAWLLIESTTGLTPIQGIVDVVLIILILPIVLFGLHAVIRVTALGRAARIFN